MLPKDILKYAKKFSPEEAKKEIHDAVKKKPIRDLAPYQDLAATLGGTTSPAWTSQWGTITSVSTTSRPGQFTTTDVTYIQ